jgi:hypothetical protein
MPAPMDPGGGGGGGSGGGAYYNSMMGGYGVAGAGMDPNFSVLNTFYPHFASSGNSFGNNIQSFVNEINGLVLLMADGKTPILSPVTIQEARTNNLFLQARIDSYHIANQMSLSHFQTMNNPLVQAMHTGSREFAAHPFGGGLLAFVSGGGLFGAGGGALARLGAKQFLMNGAKASMPILNTGKNVLLNAGRRHISSLTAKSIITNTGLSIGSQLITKQDISKVDFLDAGIAGLSGRGLGQVVGGVAGGLFDYTIGKGRVGPGSKSGYQLGVDVAIGGLSGSIGAGLNTPLIGLSPSWQTWGGFLNQMVGDGFNSTLNPDYD